MICTKCDELISETSGYFRTKKGPHHFKCGVSNLPDKITLSNATIERMIEMYDNRGPSTSKFEAMREIAKFAQTAPREEPK